MSLIRKPSLTAAVTVGAPGTLWHGWRVQRGHGGREAQGRTVRKGGKEQGGCGNSSCSGSLCGNGVVRWVARGPQVAGATVKHMGLKSVSLAHLHGRQGGH